MYLKLHRMPKKELYKFHKVCAYQFLTIFGDRISFKTFKTFRKSVFAFVMKNTDRVQKQFIAMYQLTGLFLVLSLDQDLVY